MATTTRAPMSAESLVDDGRDLSVDAHIFHAPCPDAGRVAAVPRAPRVEGGGGLRVPGPPSRRGDPARGEATP